MNGNGTGVNDWGSNLKGKFYETLDKINISQESTTNMALYGGLGFLSGFVCKKSSSYVLVALLVVLGLVLLHQYNAIHIAINWDEMSRLLGIHPAEMTGDNLFAMVWEAVKANSAISASFAVGFLIGFKLG